MQLLLLHRQHLFISPADFFFFFFAPFIQVTCSHLCTSSHVFIQLCVCVQQLAGAQKNIF